MRVSHFNTFPYGGAATAAKRMHRQLLDVGVDSEFCFHRNDKGVETDSTYKQINFDEPKFGVLTGSVQRRLHKRRQKKIYQLHNDHLALRPPGVETFSMAELPNPTKLNWSNINSDVVHLHWVSFFADYPSFFSSIPTSVPLVWTLHDMNPFTGGCHYSNQCTQFRWGCGDCHQVVNSSLNDVSRSTFSTKQDSLKHRDIHVVTPSQWLSDLAQQSKIWPTETNFEVIRLGFDLDQFHPIPKMEAREQLGIDTDAVLIGFGAEDLKSERKGIRHLLNALRIIETQSEIKTESKIECLLFGSGKIVDTAGLPKLHQLGYVDSPAMQALIYSAADIVIVPSREDNQPQVGLEAMACETPVIGFDAGGIPEYVRDGKTGFVAELGNEVHLAERISHLADNRDLQILMGQAGRLMMEDEFEVGCQTQKYLELYQSATRRQLSRAAA